MKYSEDDYILGIWQAESNSGNILISCKKSVDPLGWLVEYLYRNYKEEDIYNNIDEKSSYQFLIHNGTEEKALETVNALFKIMQKVYPKNPNFTLVQGDFKKMIILMSALPWFHAKFVDKEGNKTKLTSDNVEEFLLNETC